MVSISLLKKGALSLPRAVRKTMPAWTVPTRTLVQSNSHKPGVVVFDKDGTIVCFHSMWSPWVEDLSKKLSHHTGRDMMPIVSETLGFDENEKRIVGDSALLAHATMPICKEKIAEALGKSGMSQQEVDLAMKECWEDCSTEDRNTIVPLFDVKSVFEELRDRGIKTAICTADARSGAIGAMEELGVAHLVDHMVCGDDDHSVPKPAPNNAMTICKELGVHPADAVMVGDTTADIGMGYTAGMGAAVGVLSGIGNHHDLRKADYLVDHAGHVVDLTVHGSTAKSWRKRFQPAHWELQKGHSLEILLNSMTANVQRKDNIHSPYQTRSISN